MLLVQRRVDLRRAISQMGHVEGLMRVPLSQYRPQLHVLPTVVILGAMWYLMEIVQPRPVLQSLIILLPQSLA